jgi:urease accessory protein
MSWWSSFAHVIGEPGHVLAMLAIGTWAAMLSGRAAWVLPITFLLVTPSGDAIGASSVSLPWAEASLAGADVILGLLLVFAVRPAAPVGALVVGLFALVHGYEHGLEMPEAVNPPLYQLGLVAGAAVLHLLGFSLGWVAQRLGRGEPAGRLGGAAVPLAGVALLVSVIRQG